MASSDHVCMWSASLVIRKYHLYKQPIKRSDTHSYAKDAKRNGKR